MKQKNHNAKIKTPELNPPKGGGAYKGIGEAIQPNSFNGGASYTIALPESPSRGFEPKLALSYNSGNGNGPFGMGFALSLPKISIWTENGIPRYDGTDIYITDSGQLVRKDVKSYIENGYNVYEYLPRVVSEIIQIKHYVNPQNTSSYWEIITAKNETSYFGKTKSSRICNPHNPSQIFEWLIAESIDAKGNVITFSYKAENDDNVPDGPSKNEHTFTNRYIQNIQYGKYIDSTGASKFAFELLFNYGEYDLPEHNKVINPGKAAQKWAYRSDAFSRYNSGFEIRTCRICKDIMLFHNFEAELGDPMLVKSVSLAYQDIGKYGSVEIASPSRMSSAIASGYRRQGKSHLDKYDILSAPPVVFGFSEFSIPDAPVFNALSIEGEGIPGYLDGKGFQTVDLYGEGLSGLLYTEKNTQQYYKPLGDGVYGSPEASHTFPVYPNLEEAPDLVDLNGNGFLDLQISSNEEAGFYKKKYSENNWDSFRPFENFPTDFDFDRLERVGLNNDGKTDLLLIEEGQILFYSSLGLEGFDQPISKPKPLDFPSVKPGYRKEYVGFNDVLGDGLSHRVKITNGSIECWPDLGYGSFDSKLSFENSPYFEEDFDAQRLFLADIDGSGTADIIYVHQDRVAVYVNQSGNSFSDAIEVYLPEPYSSEDKVSFSDVLGNGTRCLVFTKAGPSMVHYYYDFVGAIKIEGKWQKSMKPYLLNAIDNNLSVNTRIQYCSSTKFYLEDQKNGTPWITRLPFPVQVVESVITEEAISGARYSQRFKYHDGYYDPVERQFRGFGYVESWDSETYEDFSKGKNTAWLPSELFVPPVYTRMWHFTGASFDNDSVLKAYKSSFYQGDPDAYDFPGPEIDPQIFLEGDKTIRQAFTALNGTVFRTEVYGLDPKSNPDLYKNPYTVEQSNLEVLLIQNIGSHPFAVFQVNPRESICYNYERNPADPRITQKFVVEVDTFGNVVQSCNIALPRRSGARKQVYTEQEKLWVSLSFSQFVKPLDGFVFCHQVCEEQGFEVAGLTHAGAYFSYDDVYHQITSLGLPARNNIIPSGGSFTSGIQALQLSWDRHFFWDSKQADRLPLGGISPVGLLYNSQQAVFTSEFSVSALDGRLIDKVDYSNNDYLKNKLYTNGGYFYDVNTDYWWNMGLVQLYFTKSKFYQPQSTKNLFALHTQSNPNLEERQEDSLCSEATITYDSYALFAVGVEQSVASGTINTTTASIDYVSTLPKEVTDLNNNTVQVLFDPLGQVIVTSILGSENCVSIGGMTLYDNGSKKAQYQPISNPNFADLTDLQKAAPYLHGASTYFYYNLQAWVSDQQPICSIELIRNNYWNSPDKNNHPELSIEVGYTDGLGRLLEKKLRVDSGLAYFRNSNGHLKLGSDNCPVEVQTNERWQVSGRTVYNNKGEPFEQYLPYFINTALYENQKDITCPPPTVIHYDPLNRPIRQDTPKGFFSKTEFTPWEQHIYDEDDTVLQSEFYQKNYPSKLSPDEKDAIDKAILFYNTPSIKVLDSMGHTFLSVQNNLGNVQSSTFDAIKKPASITSTDIWNELLSLGFLTKDKQYPTMYWLTQKFRPYTKGFSLNLPTKYQSLEQPILDTLKENDLTTYFEIDIQGRNLSSIDPRLYYSNIANGKTYFNFKYTYGMGGNTPIVTDSVDAGIARHLNNIFGAELWSWTPRDYCQLIEYDRLQRRKQLWVKKITTAGPVKTYDDFNLVEKFTYGEGEANSQDYNLRGEVYRLKDLSGIVINSSYSILKRLLSASRQIVTDYKTPVNWNSSTQPLLEQDVYSLQSSYNALSQLVDEVAPDSSIISNTYGQSGKLKTVSVEFADKTSQSIIDNIQYDAKGQRTEVDYGNGITTAYAYEVTTLRLLNQKSTKTVGAKVVQDLNYFYDPTGNITRLYNNTIDSVFTKNQKVSPLNNYAYDALYRLIKATGRQHQGIGAATYQNNASQGSFKQSIYGPVPSTNSATELETYTENYTYDGSGNLINKQHLSSVTKSWNRPLPVEDNNNHLKNFSYDAAGNMRTIDINGTVNLSFNCCENMVSAGVITRPTELDDTDYYLYDNNEQRTRKVSERMAHGGSVSLIEDKFYIGNFEVVKNYSVNASGKKSISLERNTLRIMDEDRCATVIQFVISDLKNLSMDHTRLCRFQLDNQLGSVSLEFDSKAQLITYEEYFPYGGTALITGKNQAEVKLKEYRYCGKERDDSTGFYYYGARYYPPWLGRWIKPDPAGTVDGLNLYAYVKGNPIKFKDPNGLAAVSAGKRRTRRPTDRTTGFHNLQGVGNGAGKRRRTANSAGLVDRLVGSEVNSNVDIGSLGGRLKRHRLFRSLKRAGPKASMNYLAPQGSVVRDDLDPPAAVLAHWKSGASAVLAINPAVTTMDGIHSSSSRASSRRVPIEFPFDGGVHEFAIHARSNKGPRARGALVAQAIALRDENPGEPMFLAGDFNQDAAQVQAMIDDLPAPTNTQFRVYAPDHPTHMTKSTGATRRLDFVISNIKESDIGVSTSVPGSRAGTPDHGLLKILTKRNPGLLP